MNTHRIYPAGVVTFFYPECFDLSSQQVPFKSVDALLESVCGSLDAGFDVENVACYVWDKDSANCIFTVLDEKASLPNVRHLRFPVYQLTETILAPMMKL